MRSCSGTVHPLRFPHKLSMLMLKTFTNPFIKIDDVYQVLTQLNRPTSDFQKLFCIVSLLSYIVDLNDLVNNKVNTKMCPI